MSIAGIAGWVVCRIWSSPTVVSKPPSKFGAEVSSPMLGSEDGIPGSLDIGSDSSDGTETATMFDCSLLTMLPRRSACIPVVEGSSGVGRGVKPASTPETALITDDTGTPAAIKLEARPPTS